MQLGLRCSFVMARKCKLTLRDPLNSTSSHRKIDINQNLERSQPIILILMFTEVIGSAVLHSALCSCITRVWRDLFFILELSLLMLLQNVWQPEDVQRHIIIEGGKFYLFFRIWFKNFISVESTEISVLSKCFLYPKGYWNSRLHTLSPISDLFKKLPLFQIFHVFGLNSNWINKTKSNVLQFSSVKNWIKLKI